MTQQHQASRTRKDLRPRSVIGLIAVMAAGALALVPALASDAPSGPLRLTLWMVIAMTAATELAAVHRHGQSQTHTLSLSEITLVICLAFAAPGDLILGRAIAGLVVYGGYRRLPILKTGFNTMLFVLETTVAAVVYRAVLGSGSPADLIGWGAAVLAVLAATAVGLAAVRSILAMHGERFGSGNGMATTILSLGMTAIGTSVGILAVGALWLHAGAFAVVGVVAALLYAGLRTLTDQADAELQRALLLSTLDEASGKRDAVGDIVAAICDSLRVDHVETMSKGLSECLRVHSFEGGPADIAAVGADRCSLMLDGLEWSEMLMGARIPEALSLELASRGFAHPVVVPLLSDGHVTGYLAAGSKRSPERRLTRADRDTLGLVAGRLSRIASPV